MPDVFWLAITRLGEALILLPTLLALMLWLVARSRAHRLVLEWTLLISVAVLITTASKVAFIGWGIGNVRWNFTGVSGHAMFAAAVMPLLLRASVSSAPPDWHRASILLGYACALLIAVSRVKVGAHSWSEVAAGFAVGAAASGLALARVHMPAVDAPRLLIVGVVVWLVSMPAGAPPSPTHGWVTQLALAMSGRAVPYTREDLYRRAQLPVGLERTMRPTPTL